MIKYKKIYMECLLIITPTKMSCNTKKASIKKCKESMLNLDSIVFDKVTGDIIKYIWSNGNETYPKNYE